MARIRPFRALRPQQHLAAEVASLPYDVMNSAEAKEMAQGKPNSFLHVSRAEIDLPEGTDIHSQAVYEKAKENFEALIRNGVLFQDEKPCYYIYAQTMNGRTQHGLAASSAIDDYFNDVIKKHEFTRPEKEQDRINHMKAMQAHVGPVFLTFPSHAKIAEIINQTTASNAVYDLTAEDGIRHQLWLIDDEKTITEITETFAKEIPFTYIADGHHRAASAAKVGLAMRENASTVAQGEQEYDYFLTVIFPSDELAIMDYNRLVKDLNGFSADTFLNEIEKLFDVEKTHFEKAKPATLHELSMYLNGQWYKLKTKENNIKTDPIGVLDVTILQENVLRPLLGINDPRTDTRIDFVGGIRGLAYLQKQVDSGAFAVAFALYPVTIQQLMDIADSGNVMPPKSTWFEPKLRDGLLSHLF